MSAPGSDDWTSTPEAGRADPPLTIDPADLPRIVNRLRRAEGQLGAVIRMLETGRGCREVIPQLAAVTKALDRAGFTIIASSLRDCATASRTNQETASLEKLFLTLA